MIYKYIILFRLIIGFIELIQLLIQFLTTLHIHSHLLILTLSFIFWIIYRCNNKSSDNKSRNNKSSNNKSNIIIKQE